MSNKLLIDAYRMKWIAVAMLGAAANYSMYLYPLPSVSADNWPFESITPDQMLVSIWRIWIGSLLLTVLAVSACLLTVLRVRFWWLATLLCIGIGLLTSDIPSTWNIFVKDSASFEEIGYQIATLADYPWILAAIARNSVFMPMLFVAALILLGSGWWLSRTAHRDI